MLGLILFSLMVSALDADSQDSLNKTQTLLKDRSQRESAAKATPESREAHEKAKNVAGSPENTDKIYNISSDIMATLTEESGGDPQKLQEIVNSFKANPQAFYDRLTPAQREQIRGLAADIEKNQGKPSKP